MKPVSDQELVTPVFLEDNFWSNLKYTKKNTEFAESFGASFVGLVSRAGHATILPRQRDHFFRQKND